MVAILVDVILGLAAETTVGATTAVGAKCLATLPDTADVTAAGCWNLCPVPTAVVGVPALTAGDIDVPGA